MPETVVEREVRATMADPLQPGGDATFEGNHMDPFGLAGAGLDVLGLGFPLLDIAVQQGPAIDTILQDSSAIAREFSFDPSADPSIAVAPLMHIHAHPTLNAAFAANASSSSFAAASSSDGAWTNWTPASPYIDNRFVQPPGPPVYPDGSHLTRFASTSTVRSAPSPHLSYSHGLLANNAFVPPDIYSSLHSPMLNAAMLRTARPPMMSHPESPRLHRYPSTTPSGSDSSRDPTNHLGSVRCYWALLVPRNGFAPMRKARRVRPPPLIPAHGHVRQEPVDRAGAETYSPAEQELLRTFDLDFLYLDPVLSAHMATQGMSMLDRGVTEFVHPDFRDQFRRDLYDALSVDDLVGSMTGTTFARVSRIRTILGCPKEDLTTAEDAATFCIDDHYLHLNLTIHWACDGMLLAFFHATVDKDPTSNNDVNRKQEDLWTNFCGTAVMPDQQIKSLWQNVSSRVRCPEPAPGSAPPTRTFIIYSGPDAAERPDQVIFAWPPPRIRNPPEVAVASGLGSPHMDGLYYANDLEALMKEVWRASESTSTPWGQHGQSSCTARFEQLHELRNEGVYRRVQALYIPYGNLVFASFQTMETQPLRRLEDEFAGGAHSWNAQHTPVSSAMASPLHRFDAHSASPSLAATGSPYTGFPSGAQEGIFAARQDAYGAFPPDANGAAQYPDYRYDDGLGGFADSVQGTGQKRKLVYPPQDDRSRPPAPRRPSSLASVPPPPEHPAAGAHTNARGPAATDGDTPSKRPHRRVSAEGKAAPAVRPAVPPPPGVTACIACGTEASPEWRRSEQGTKELCNACGLKLARKQAKAQGRKMPRKKKSPQPSAS